MRLTWTIGCTQGCNHLWFGFVWSILSCFSSLGCASFLLRGSLAKSALHIRACNNKMNLMAPRSPNHGLLQLDTLCRAEMLLLPSRPAERLLLPSRPAIGELQLAAPALSDVVASQFMKLALCLQRRCRSQQQFRRDLLATPHTPGRK